jgi:hypothetical protein
VPIVVNNNVTEEWWGLGLERRGWGLGWGTVVYSGSVCCLLDGIGCRSRVLSTGFLVISSCDVLVAVGGLSATQGAEDSPGV